MKSSAQLWTRRLCSFYAPALGILVVPALGASSAPVPVSPGRAGGLDGLAERCPTFHWAPATGANAVELLVYEIGDETASDGSDPQAVLRVTLPGAAAGYTAPPGGCLARGRSYAWMLRARGDDGKLGEWTEPSFFSVAAEPSAREVADARDVLRRRAARKRDRSSPAAAAGEGRTRLRPRQDPAASLAPALTAESSSDLARDRRRALRRAGADPGGALRRASAAAAPSPFDDASLSVTENVRLGASSNVFKAGKVLLWDDADDNIALGRDALASNTSGTGNSAFGASALSSNTNGESNTTVGRNAALESISADYTVAVGAQALRSNTSGIGNVAVGADALRNLGSYAYSAGDYNIALGDQAGLNLGIGTAAGSFNIHIGHLGYADDTYIIRIGNDQFGAYMAGVYDQELAYPGSAQAVYVDSAGKLAGISVSSRRFKEDVRDLGDDSRAILDLRPVAFRYKRGLGRRASAEVEPDARPLEAGLIAEEVAEVMPQLVQRDAGGEPLGVQYHELIPFLLNELQRQERELAVLRERVALLDRRSQTEWGPRSRRAGRQRQN
jgi:hypothetical protein